MSTPTNDTPAPQWAVYRKKPVAIQAIQWTGENLCEVINFTGKHPRWSEWFATWEDYEARVRADGGIFKIITLEGAMEATPGDWIIRGVKGEHYPCKPDIFAATYEPTAPTAQPDAERPLSWDEVHESVAQPAATGTPLDWADQKDWADLSAELAEARAESAQRRKDYLDVADAIAPRSGGPQDLVERVRALRAQLTAAQTELKSAEAFGDEETARYETSQKQLTARDGVIARLESELAARPPIK